MKEVSFIFYIHIPKPEVFCKLFEYNQSCITVAESNKLVPTKKHIVINYHDLQRFVLKEIIFICYIDTQEKKRTFLLSHSKNNYAYIYEENYLGGDLRS